MSERMLNPLRPVLQYIVERLKGRSVARAVLVLAGGTALAQGISILAAPVLTRIYSPGEFGVLAVYMSILSVLGVVTSLRYELAIPLPREDRTAINLLKLSLLLSVATGAVFGVACMLMRSSLVRWTNTPALQPHLWLLPIGLIGGGCYQALTYWAIRKRAYGPIARTKLSQNIGMAATQIGAGLLHFGAAGLVVGDVLGRIAGSTDLARLAVRDRKAIPAEEVGISWAEAASRYRRFPLMSSGSALINSAVQSLPVLLMSGLYGPDLAGLLMISQRIGALPAGLVGQSVAQVYFGEASALAHGDPQALRAAYLGFSKRLLSWGTVPIVFLGFSGPLVFGIVFGSTWREAGILTTICSPMLLAQFVVSPVSQTLNVLERQDVQLVWDIIRFLLVTGSIIAAHHLRLNARWAIGAYSLIMSVCYVALFLVSESLLRQRSFAYAHASRQGVT